MNCKHCQQEAKFSVYELYLADDGVGAIERFEPVCKKHAAKAEPDGLDQAYANYEFRVQADPEAFGMSEIGGGGDLE